MKIYIVMTDIPFEPSCSWITYFTDKQKAKSFFKKEKLRIYEDWTEELSEQEITELDIKDNENEYYIGDEYCGRTLYLKEAETDNYEKYDLF